MVCEMLQILERFDLCSLGHNTADYIRTLAEAMKYATIDKDKRLPAGLSRLPSLRLAPVATAGGCPRHRPKPRVLPRLSSQGISRRDHDTQLAERQVTDPEAASLGLAASSMPTRFRQAETVALTRLVHSVRSAMSTLSAPWLCAAPAPTSTPALAPSHSLSRPHTPPSFAPQASGANTPPSLAPQASSVAR